MRPIMNATKQPRVAQQVVTLGAIPVSASERYLSPHSLVLGAGLLPLAQNSLDLVLTG